MSSVIQLDCFREVRAEKSVVLDRRRLNIAEALLGLNLKRSFHRIPHPQRAGEHGPGYDGTEQRAKVRACVVREAIKNKPAAGHYFIWPSLSSTVRAIWVASFSEWVTVIKVTFSSAFNSTSNWPS